MTVLSTDGRQASQAILLPADLVALIEGHRARIGLAGPVDVVRLALERLEQQMPADGSAPTAGATFDLAELRTAHDGLEAVRADRDFVIALSARQRAAAHPETIMQLTVDALGQRLSVARAGVYRVVGPTLDFGACWTDGSVDRLDGPIPIAKFGDGFGSVERQGETIVTEDCHTDPAIDPAAFAAIHAVAMVSVPLIRNRAWVAGFYLHHPEPRQWSAADLALIEEVANIAWDAVERATASRALREQFGRQSNELVQAGDDLRLASARAEGAEDQVRQLQKMEAVGQLTGGIAHDFNNMLAVIIGGLNLMQRRLDRGDTNVSKYIDAVMDGANRAAALTHRLLAFSRQQPLAPQPLDANRMIADMTDLLKRTLGEQVAVETVLTAGLWMMRADPSQLENAILNLAVNSRDAMVGGGNLTIETGNAHVDSSYARLNDVPEGQYVLFAITDTGAGMSADILGKVFEPFFTTKGAGKGTGLGLSQVFGFVRQSGGAVKVYSEVGHGTTVKVYLPRYYGEATPIVIAPAPATAIRGGSRDEIVLVVEDEERVRAHNVEALRDLGYTAIHAASGAEALTLFETGQDVTLLFTDIVMPGMTGRQLADEATRCRPGLKVIYTTGYTRNAVVHNGVLDPGTNFLPKPHTIDQLARIVRHVLDGPPTPKRR